MLRMTAFAAAPEGPKQRCEWADTASMDDSPHPPVKYSKTAGASSMSVFERFEFKLTG
jgi:hypothetical protein